MSRKRRAVMPGGKIKELGGKKSNQQGTEDVEQEETGEAQQGTRGSGSGQRRQSLLGGLVQKAYERVVPPKPEEVPDEGPVQVGSEGDGHVGAYAVRRKRQQPQPEEPVAEAPRRGWNIFGLRRRQTRREVVQEYERISKPAGAEYRVYVPTNVPPYITYRGWPEAYQFYVSQGFNVQGDPGRFSVRGGQRGQFFQQGQNLHGLHDGFFEA